MFLDNEYFEAYSELFRAIERTDGTIPVTVFEKLKQEHGPVRLLFETWCRQIEAQLKAQAEAERLEQEK